MDRIVLSTIAASLLAGSALAQAPDGLPMDAAEGTCFARVLVPDSIETVTERVEDADTAIEKAGDAAKTVTEAGERAWSTLKIAGIVAASVAGAAIMLPPIIRAFRD